MKSVSQLVSDTTVAAALGCCLVLSVGDIALRLLPERSQSQAEATEAEMALFSRQAPSATWLDWRTLFLQERAEATKQALEAQSNAPLDGESDATHGALLAEQQGDVETLNVEGLSYQLLGVFNKISEANEGDVFAVLQSERDQGVASSSPQSLTIRKGGSVGSYRVQVVRARSVVFESTVDDRLVTLWLFRSGLQ